MILAIESCHKFGFIHRDIKPDVGATGLHFVTVTDKNKIGFLIELSV
jgi:hypothetical protein